MTARVYSVYFVATRRGSAAGSGEKSMASDPGEARRVSVVEAARALLSVCDGAVRRDGSGFNANDAPFVMSVMSQRFASRSQLETVYRILAKYRAQLASLGIEYGLIEKPRRGQPTAEGATPIGSGFAVPADDEASAAPDPAPTQTTAAAPETGAPLAWDFTTEELLSFFPAGYEPRPQQTSSLAKINAAFRSGKRVVALELSTGSGKSFVCICCARAIRSRGGNTHFLAIAKQLQGQYEADFPAPEIELLKGRSNYQCTVDPERDCSDAPCKDMRRGILPECVEPGAPGEDRPDEPSRTQKAVLLQLPPSDHRCPYWRQLQKAHDNPITLFNFSSFLCQQRVGRFGNRDLMIVDEAHRIEDLVMSFVSIDLTERALSAVGVGIDREISSKSEFTAWLRETDLLSKIEKKLEGAGDPRLEGFGKDADAAETEALRSLQGKLQNFMAYLDRAEWVVETETYVDRGGDPVRRIKARPLYAKEFANDLLFSKADRILVMSATILDVRVWATSLGLAMGEIEHISVPSDFPVANRPVHLTYAGNCSRKAMPETLPRLLKSVRGIMDRHAGQRGIIHTQSFDLSDLLGREVGSPRFLFQQDFGGDKEAMLEEHSRRPDSVIVAPAMAEGVDLKGALGRFQIILKMPWPSLGDRVVRERSERDPRWYSWMCAVKFCQSLGRVVRSAEDFAHTYVLDSGLEGFMARNPGLIPAWVRAAFTKYGPAKIMRD